MKVSCLQENLAKGLRVVSRAVAGRSTTLPVLSNVMLSTENGRLKLAATDLEIAISCWIGAKIEQDGAITVPARTFIDLVNTFPSDRIDMELLLRTRTLHMQCGRSEANIKGLDAQEFPIIPEPESDGQILVEADALLKTIDHVAFAAATDESRLMLTGVMSKFDHDRLTMAATDGFRLSICDTQLKTPVSEPVHALIPSRALRELSRILGDQEDPVEIKLSASRQRVLFHLTSITLVASLIDLQFPDFERLIPEHCFTRTVAATGDLLKASRTASIFAREAANTARLHIVPGSKLAPGCMAVTASSQESGDNFAEVDVASKGEEIEIAFNVRYLLDFLAVVDTPEVALETSTPTGPGVFKPVGDEGFVHVISPMHIGR